MDQASPLTSNRFADAAATRTETFMNHSLWSVKGIADDSGMTTTLKAVTGCACKETSYLELHTIQRDDDCHVEDVDGLGGG